MALEDMDVDVCPMEDVILLLLEFLVDRKLPANYYEGGSLSHLDHESVAKQVHAVVLLYNYFYRKQHPQLEFIGFESFCKLAVVLRPCLLAYMKFMQMSSDDELVDLQKQLSLTEKRIMDACDVSMTLDASVNAPCIENWPISKVAVFLVDYRKENCLLQFSAITDGVWSILEKDVNSSNKSSEDPTISEHAVKKKKIIRKPARVEGIDEANLQQLAFSTVMEATGINQSDLTILDSNVVYSVSKEKAATRFYVMQCTQLRNDNIPFPIKDVINSLQGPLAKKNSYRWTHTTVVEYFHLLPYAGMLLQWICKEWIPLQVQTMGLDVNSGSKEDSRLPKQNDDNADPGSNRNSDSRKRNSEGSSLLADSDALSKLVEVNDASMVHNKIEKNARYSNSKVQRDDFQNMTFLESRINGATHCNNKAKIFDTTARQAITEPIGENFANQSTNGNMFSNHDEKLASVHAPENHQCNVKDLDKSQATMSSKDKELSQTFLTIALRKRDKLSLQQRDIEDQIAQYDRFIQTMLNGGENGLVDNIESIIEGSDDVCLRNIVTQKRDQEAMGESLSQLTKRKRVIDTMINMQNPCQVLDEKCYDNNWILPTYHVSFVKGGFCANVSLKGMDFECSSMGEVCSHPHQARESAAMQMLAKLQK